MGYSSGAGQEKTYGFSENLVKPASIALKSLDSTLLRERHLAQPFENSLH
jgi:hypothetical protein